MSGIEELNDLTVQLSGKTLMQLYAEESREPGESSTNP